VLASHGPLHLAGLPLTLWSLPTRGHLFWWVLSPPTTLYLVLNHVSPHIEGFMGVSLPIVVGAMVWDLWDPSVLQGALFSCSGAFFLAP
jgi:hypothetical protein